MPFFSLGFYSVLTGRQHQLFFLFFLLLSAIVASFPRVNHAASFFVAMVDCSVVPLVTLFHSLSNKNEMKTHRTFFFLAIVTDTFSFSLCISFF
jgi:hypothetical protein